MVDLTVYFLMNQWLYEHGIRTASYLGSFPFSM